MGPKNGPHYFCINTKFALPRFARAARCMPSSHHDHERGTGVSRVSSGRGASSPPLRRGKKSQRCGGVTLFSCLASASPSWRGRPAEYDTLLNLPRRSSPVAGPSVPFSPSLTAARDRARGRTVTGRPLSAFRQRCPRRWTCDPPATVPRGACMVGSASPQQLASRPPRGCPVKSVHGGGVRGADPLCHLLPGFALSPQRLPLLPYPPPWTSPQDCRGRPPLVWPRDAIGSRTRLG